MTVEHESTECSTEDEEQVHNWKEDTAVRECARLHKKHVIFLDPKHKWLSPQQCIISLSKIIRKITQKQQAIGFYDFSFDAKH